MRAALGRGDDVDERAGHALVAGPPAQRDVDPELPLDLRRRQVALLVEDGDGLAEVPHALEPKDVHQRRVGGEVLAEL